MKIALIIFLFDGTMEYEYHDFETIANCKQYIATELVKKPGELYTCGFYGD